MHVLDILHYIIYNNKFLAMFEIRKLLQILLYLYIAKNQAVLREIPVFQTSVWCSFWELTWTNILY